MWRLAREGGDQCHAILAQLAAKWIYVCEPNPEYHLPIAADTSALALLDTHISLSYSFADSLNNALDHPDSLGRVRRSRVQIKLDQEHALDGNSSANMEKVWTKWEDLNRDEQSEPRALIRWAWNQRSASCPPLHHTFRRQLLEPLDSAFVVPESPVRSEKYFDWPLASREHSNRQAMQGDLRPPKDTKVKGIDSGTSPRATRSSRNPTNDSHEVVTAQEPHGSHHISRSTPVGGGASRPKRTGKRAQSYYRAPSKRTSEKSVISVPAVKSEVEPSIILRHSVWDVVDLDEDPRPESNVFESISFRLDASQPPISVRFYLPGMVRLWLLWYCAYLTILYSMLNSDVQQTFFRR